MENNSKTVAKDWTKEKPHAVTGLDLAFGVRELLPAYDLVPQEFKRWDGTNEEKLVGKLFFKGGTLKPLVAKDGIDRDAAIKHIRACLASWEPKHEHKTAGCAYLFNLWFTPESIKETLDAQEARS